MARVTCPTCHASTPWDGNPHRPFCSLTCRLIDLGVWLDERYRIPAEPGPDEISAARPDDAADADGESPYADSESPYANGESPYAKGESSDAEGRRVS